MICLTFVSSVIAAICCSATANIFGNEEDTLQLVHVLLRHGNRTPDGKGYNSNPIDSETYYEPYGYGQLTNEGKRTEYKIGTTLRKRYNKFLGKTWNVNYIDTRTTDTNRTRMSLELALAGLWPPSISQIFEFGLNWMPIPYNYLYNDKELEGIKICSNYATMYEAVENSHQIQEALSQYSWVFDYISHWTGQEFNTVDQIFDLYFDLTTQQEYGHPLEKFWQVVFPDYITKIAKDAYYIGTNTTDLKKIAAGYLLRKIVTDSQAKMNGTIIPSTRKMFLYSAHERNVANLLITLGVFDDKIPPYGAHVIVEFHRIGDVYGFKIFYQNWSESGPIQLTIPGCKPFCPIDQFVSLFSEVIPDDRFCHDLIQPQHLFVAKIF